MSSLARVIQLMEAAPNPLFTKEQTALVRFVRYFEAGRAVKTACAECGKKKQVLWTMLCSFRVPRADGFVLKASEKLHPPLAGVCQSHILAPELTERKSK